MIRRVSVVGRDEVGWGAEIDRGDLVVRMYYFGPSEGSGEKYDIGMINNSNCQFKELRRLERRGKLRKPRLGWWWYVCRGDKRPKPVLGMPVLRIADLCYLSSWTPKGKLLTKGGVALILAIEEFGPCRLDAFGFGKVLCGAAPEGCHNYFEERELILKFAKQRGVEVYHECNRVAS